MTQPFDKDTLQEALLRAGATPRDFEQVLPCHVTTMYAFLRTGSSRQTATFTFDKIQKFINYAIPVGFFPLRGSSAERQSNIKRAFNYWSTHDYSLEGFVIWSAPPTEPVASS